MVGIMVFAIPEVRSNTNASFVHGEVTFVMNSQHSPIHELISQDIRSTDRLPIRWTGECESLVLRTKAKKFNESVLKRIGLET
jgi:hypothetical protein